MKLTIIHGNVRHGSTWHCADLLKQELARYGDLETKEFSLPKDMPHFCTGCFSCFYNGESTCPHASSMSPILAAMLEADVIVLTSPVYAFDVSGGMKALLDHLCFQWVSHRPNPKMFKKVGVTIVTTAGAGLSHATKTLRNSLSYWGAKRVFSYKNPVAAMKWDDVSDKKKAASQKNLAALAKKVAHTAQNADKMHPTLFFGLFFKMMAGMMKNNTWNLRDKKHWEENGWLKKAART